MNVLDYNRASGGLPMPKISILIPVYDERDVLPLCVDRLLEKKYSHPEIQVVSLARNFGKEAALTAVLDHVGLWICFKALVIGDSVQGYPSLIAILTFLCGTQLFTIGILGEYVGKTDMETKQRPVYLLKKPVQADVEKSVARQDEQKSSPLSV